MRRSPLFPLLALAAGIALAGCTAAPVSEAEQPPAASGAPAPEAAPEISGPGVQVGGDEYIGELAWPANWPEGFPRVGGEILAAEADTEGGRFSVVMYVQEDTAEQLIAALEALPLTLLHRHDDNGVQVAFENPDWRVDVVGVIQDGTDLPHLRYLIQRQD